MAIHGSAEPSGTFAGLPPTAEVPQGRTKTAAPCYGPCPGCGLPVLTGKITTGVRTGQHATVETQAGHLPVWVVIYDNGAAEPRLVESQGYPEHRCPVSKGHA